MTATKLSYETGWHILKARIHMLNHDFREKLLRSGYALEKVALTESVMNTIVEAIVQSMTEMEEQLESDGREQT